MVGADGGGHLSNSTNLVIVSKMQELMSLIDENAHLIPEGEYLKMCECMKKLDRGQSKLYVTPGDFTMTSDAFTICHRWIVATDGLRDAYTNYTTDPDNIENMRILIQVREACKTLWRELTQTHGYDELMWFIHKGTIAQRNFRHLSSIERM
jgi:hypothetical protein